MTAFGLREYLQDLEAAGELKHVAAEVDPHLEVGAMSRLVCERSAPAPLFENLRGYDSQYRIAAVLNGPGQPLHARVAIALGLPKDITPKELIETVRQRIKTPVAPQTVGAKDAPCKEVILRGDEVDLTKFPVPWIKAIDGGPYLGTWDIVITKDPDSEWVNWGMYRCMLKDERSFCMLLFPRNQHGGGILERWHASGQAMPVALVIGADPYSHLGAIASVGRGVSEVEIAGALRGKGIELVKCETSDLMVPATAEMVIEATIAPGDMADEGPFGEYTGHAAHRGVAPVARVTCVTHRASPIMTVANMGKPFDDNAVPVSILDSAVAMNELEFHGINVSGIYYYGWGVGPVVALDPRPGLTKKIVSILISRPRLLSNATGVVFVDSDVDPSNVLDVWWAITSRLHPDRFEVMRRVSLNPLIAWVTPEERERGETCLSIMDATFPYQWTSEYREAHTQVSDFAHGWSAETQELVLSRWHEYGY